MSSSKQKQVAYFYDEEMTNYNYGGGNPMRPHRVRLTTNLVNGYGLTDKMRLLRPAPRTREQIMEFHADDYVDFLISVTPENQDEFMMQMRRFNLGPVGEADCPVFDGMFEYFQIYTGGSVGGAALINDGDSDIVMNWSGGMHHAKKGEASGFCYINDIVLAILELLRVHQRVLYVDIDIHHGDGVEEAFYTTDRVMTVSFHKYGDFFPGTGAAGDVGYGPGKLYAVNVPMGDGMDDDSYKFMFEPIMQKVMESYQPGAVVICGGADSLSGDKLGSFNLSLQGHSNCIEFLEKFNVPLLVLGGGGYTMRNVARCWCYETGRLLGVDLPDELPEDGVAEYNYYMDTNRLRIPVSNMKNTNTRENLEKLRIQILEQLSQLPPAPSAQMAVPPPPLTKQEDLPEEEMEVRGGGEAYEDKRVVKDEDYASDGDMDDKALRNDANAGEAATGNGEAEEVKMEEEPAQVKDEPAAAASIAVEEAVPAAAPAVEAAAEGAPQGDDAAFLNGIAAPVEQAAAPVAEAPLEPDPMQVDDAEPSAQQ